MLNELIKEINQTSIKRIIIEGYTDSIGTIKFNQNLSLSRAIAVQSYLIKKIEHKKISLLTNRKNCSGKGVYRLRQKINQELVR